MHPLRYQLGVQAIIAGGRRMQHARERAGRSQSIHVRRVSAVASHHHSSRANRTQLAYPHALAALNKTVHLHLRSRSGKGRG